MRRHEEKRARLLDALRGRGTGGVGLAKRTSNLFRDRIRGENIRARPRIDLSGFNEVVRVDVAGGRVEAEGMTTYSDLVKETLAHGVMPCVVPQLKSITLGGAAAGVGIEASSFRYGLVHDTLLALDVLLADGGIVTCTPDNEHRDLFFGFPNSYGTLGYAIKVTARTAPVKPCVRIEHVRHADPKRYFEDLEARCRAGDADFVDGTVFSGEEMYITLGRFADGAPCTSDYTFEHIYYRSIREKETDYLSTRDFIWRWDTDWFWCSKNLFAQNPLVRRLLGRERLNSTTYAKVMRWNSKWGFTRAFSRLAGKYPESVIQDVDIPVSRAPEFLAFFLEEIGILPVWICPIGGYDPQAKFPLYPVDPRTLYVNFGFWDVVKDPVRRESGFYNRRIERKVAELGGVKSLYSDSYYPEDEFWRLYNRPAYDALKRRYDPQGRFKNLYQKCVLRH
ncbi:MAG TPA: FAD-binding oxidoreductase [Burkholderiales bacterium]|nr:FAD-binding oxidoreductase [Burkholderiales bacterium]